MKVTIVPGVFVKSMAEAREQLTRLSKMYALMDESTLNDRVFEKIEVKIERFGVIPLGAVVQFLIAIL